MFYVFYDKDDFVKFFGTSEELVRQGYFKDKIYVRILANKIRKNIVKGNVVILPLTE